MFVSALLPPSKKDRFIPVMSALLALGDILGQDECEEHNGELPLLSSSWTHDVAL